MNEDKSSDVDMSMHNVEGEGESDDGEGERGSEGKERHEMKVKVKKKTPQEIKVENRAKFKLAAADLLAGKFKNVRQAALAYNISYTSLWYGMVKNGGEFQGSGKFTDRLSPEEEKKVTDHVKWRASIGYGVDWQMLRLLLQEVLVAVTRSNPERITGLEEKGQLPDISYVRRFAERHQLVPRATMGISKGRQVVTQEELALWQGDSWSFLSANPELLAALQVN